jgi:mitochondrial cardiolipin hydrolase
MNSITQQALADIIEQIEASLTDLRLSDDERRSLIQALRQASPPEEGLRQLRNRAFELVRERLFSVAPPDHLALVKWLEGVVRALDTGRQPTGVVQSRAHFSPGEDCLHAILGQLRAVRREADLCVFTISDDRITDAILAAHQRGVAVRIITDNDKASDMGSDVALLERSGISVRVDRTPAHMHHKFALFDSTWLINGSYNWTRSACEHNEENLIVTNEPLLVARFLAKFHDLWGALGP